MHTDSVGTFRRANASKTLIVLSPMVALLTPTCAKFHKRTRFPSRASLDGTSVNNHDDAREEKISLQARNPTPPPPGGLLSRAAKSLQLIQANNEQSKWVCKFQLCACKNRFFLYWCSPQAQVCTYRFLGQFVVSSLRVWITRA